MLLTPIFSTPWILACRKIATGFLLLGSGVPGWSKSVSDTLPHTAKTGAPYWTVIKRKMFRDPRKDEGGTSKHWFPWPHEGRYFAAKWEYTWPRTSPLGGEPEKPDQNPG